ncbi:MAG: class I SAM-dependent methyltransferase [Planctomycetota bacterium]
MADSTPSPDPVAPYRDAVARFGPKFEALLWAKPAAQVARFDAIIDLVRTEGAVIADIGCGLADLAARLDAREAGHTTYVGVDALGELIDEASARTTPLEGAPRKFLQADFGADEGVFARLVEHQHARVFVFSGSLNTFEQDAAAEVLGRAWEAVSGVPGGQLAFNFLSTRHHRPGPDNTAPAVRFDPLGLLDWALARTPLVRFRQDHLHGHDGLIWMAGP